MLIKPKKECEWRDERTAGRREKIRKIDSIKKCYENMIMVPREWELDICVRQFFFAVGLIHCVYNSPNLNHRTQKATWSDNNALDHTATENPKKRKVHITITTVFLYQSN